MDENRERQMDMDVEDTPQDRVEHEELEQREHRAEQRTDERVSENRAPADTMDEKLEPGNSVRAGR